MKNKRRKVTGAAPFTHPRRNGTSYMLLRDSSKNEYKDSSLSPKH